MYGPDGSGKTTLAVLLYSVLERSGGRPVLSWMRGSHNVSSLLARLLYRLGLGGGCNPYFKVCLPSGMFTPWLALELFSAIPVLLSRYFLPRLLGYTVVGMRAPLDLPAWIALTFNMDRIGWNWQLRALTTILSRTCNHILVTASPRELEELRALGYLGDGS